MGGRGKGADRVKVGELRNGFGVSVSLHHCVYCEGSFTVTPATDDAFGLGCLAETCSSYDLERDVDLFFEAASEAGLIRRST